MTSSLQQLDQKLNQAQTLLIFLPPQPSFDALAAALGLHLTLKNKGLHSTVATTYQPTAGDSHLVAVNTLTDNISNEYLRISFPYLEKSVDKVSSEIEGDTFHLFVKPQKGQPPIDKNTVTLSYGGARADLIFLVGASTKKDIGPLLTQEESLNDVPLVVINQTSSPLKEALQFIDPQASLSEITTALLAELKYPLTQDAAQNLLLGIEHATNNLTSQQITADTFEALAVLYRAGARRQPTSSPSSPLTSSPTKSSSQFSSKATLDQASATAPKPDWLKPKIYRSSQPIAKS